MADIRYKIVVDAAEAQRRIERFNKIAAESAPKFEKLLSSFNNVKLDSSLSNFSKAYKDAASGMSDLNRTRLESANIEKQQKQARLDEIKAIGDLRREIAGQRAEQSRLTTEAAKSTLESQKHKTTINELKVAEQQLNATYKQGKIDAQQYELEQKRLSDAQKLAAAAQKEADRQAREHVKLLNDQLRLERQKEAQIERNRKKVQQESSEYYKLNQALTALRRRTKDVLAEMFNMERAGQRNSAAYKMLEQRSKGMVAQTQFLDRALKKIDATLGLHQRNVGNYASALDAISPTFARINSQLAIMGVNLTEIATKPGGFKELATIVSLVGKNILAFLVTPIGLAITALASLYALIKGNASTVIQFNSGLLNVGKTTGIAGQQLNKLGDSLIALSRKLQVVSADKLLEYATVAGQLGVKGTENILKFTEALAKLETASNIQGEEGGSQIARLLTLVDGGVQNVADFGDEIVNLGNNFAATEKEILENATAIAQNVGLYKIGRKEVLAYATATKSVGIEAELVGSTFNRTLGIFEKSIRTGKNLSTILQVTGKSAEELKTQFRENASGVFNDFIKGLNQIDKAGGSVNQALNNIGITAVRDTRVIASLATNGYDVLTDALNKAGAAAGSMDQEFETAAGKLEKQFSRIGIAWDNLVLSIENGTGVLGRSAAKISEIFADTLEWVTKLVTATSSNEFFIRMVPWAQEEADAVRAGNMTLRETIDVLKEARKIDYTNVTTQALIDQVTMLDGALSTLEKQIKKTDKAIGDGLLNEGSSNGLKKAAEDVKRLKEASEQLLAVRPRSGSDPINPLTEEESDKQKRAREAAARRAEEAVKRQRDLQAKIDEVNKKARREQLGRDEEEIQSVKDKYAEIRRAVDTFLKDSRNKGLKIDMSGLTVSEKLEVDEIVAKQQLEIEKHTIEQKKVLFNQYEEYKKQVGREKANEAFSADLNGFEDYIKYLRSLMPAETDTSVKANKTRDYLSKTAIPAAQKDQQKRDAELYRESLLAAQTYSDQIRAVQQRLADDITRLKETASQEQLNYLRRTAKEEISAITATAIKQETQWEDMFSNMFRMGQKSARDWLKQSRDRIEVARLEGKLTPEQYKRMVNEIEDRTQDLNVQNPFRGFGVALDNYRKKVKQFGKGSDEAKLAFKDLAEVAAEAFGIASQGIGDVANSLNELGIGGEGLQETLGKVQDLLGGISQLGKGIASGDIGSIIGGAIKTITSVFSLFNTHDKKLQKQIEGYQKALVALERQYNQLQRSIENSVGTSYYDDSAAAISNLQQQVKNLTAARDAESKKKKADKDAIEGYNDQIIAVNNAIEDLQKTISEQLLQTNFKQLSDNLANALLSAFEAGENGIEAMNKTFDQFIKNALANSLKLKLIEPLMKQMTDDLTAYMLGNDKSLAGYDFTSWKDSLEEAGKDFNTALEEAYKGLGLSKDSEQNGGSGLSGQIGRSITEESANKWMGIQLNLYTIAKNSLSESQVQSSLQRQYLNYAQQNLDGILAIQRNTADTVVRLDTAVGYLVTIANNTKPGKVGRDLGI